MKAIQWQEQANNLGGDRGWGRGRDAGVMAGGGSRDVGSDGNELLLKALFCET